MENLVKALRLIIPVFLFCTAYYKQDGLEIEAFVSFTALLWVELFLVGRQKKKGRMVTFYCLAVFLFVSYGLEGLGGGMGMETVANLLLIPMAFALIASTIVYLGYAILDLSGILSPEQDGAGQPDNHPENS